jgi:hypothetical protein
MSNGSKSHTMVTQVQIVDEATLNVSLEVSAFMPNESVEISGYVAQNHGSFATFNDFQPINSKLGETANLMVKATAVEGSPAFQQGDFTVFIRVAKVWVTVLGQGQVQPQGISFNKAVPGAVFGRIKGVAGSDSYSDPQGDNQSASYAGNAEQAASSGASNSETG